MGPFNGFDNVIAVIKASLIKVSWRVSRVVDSPSFNKPLRFYTEFKFYRHYIERTIIGLFRSTRTHRK